MYRAVGGCWVCLLVYPLHLSFSISSIFYARVCSCLQNCVLYNVHGVDVCVLTATTQPH